ncbi:MAG: MarR family transcriptional regulator [Solirubrobacteraceae bacterium]
MASATHPRLENLLAALSLNVADDAVAALELVSGLSGSASAGLLALEEFLDQAHIGRLADVLGLTHSGAVRLVRHLEAEGLVVRRVGGDRRRVEVRLTARGRRRARAARAARDSVVRETTSGLSEDEAAILEGLLAKLVEARVTARVADRRAWRAAPWWCRTCNFSACGRPEGHCPAQATVAQTV